MEPVATLLLPWSRARRLLPPCVHLWCVFLLKYFLFCCNHKSILISDISSCFQQKSILIKADQRQHVKADLFGHLREAETKANNGVYRKRINIQRSISIDLQYNLMEVCGLKCFLLLRGWSSVQWISSATMNVMDKKMLKQLHGVKPVYHAVANEKSWNSWFLIFMVSFLILPLDGTNVRNFKIPHMVALIQ